MKQMAILGPTASGKTEAALHLANRYNCYILSLDSLSVYKDINIVSAKPSKDELVQIKHFGVDEIYPDVEFNANIFADIYNDAKKKCLEDEKNLIIVGGTSFYLKSLINGLSFKPKFSQQTLKKAKQDLQHLDKAYKFIAEKDSKFAQKISSNDPFRIEKWLLTYYETGLSLTLFFEKHPPKPVIKDIDIYEIEVDKDLLRKRIKLRTKKMIQTGLVDEIKFLEKKYTREPKPFKAIGIKETFDYIDGKINLEQLENLISTHTAQLAKRQRTFNRTQFKNVKRMSLNKIKDLTLLSYCDNIPL
jgi:tRNA dimethylallyltransferase